MNGKLAARYCIANLLDSIQNRRLLDINLSGSQSFQPTTRDRLAEVLITHDILSYNLQ